MAQDKDHNVIHVELEEPIELRKNILKTAIDITDSQKSCQTLNTIKLEKEHYKKELKKVLGLLDAEIKKIDEILPQIKREEPKPVEENVVKEKPKHILTRPQLEKIDKAVQKTISKDKLSSELEELGRKLRSL